MKEMILNRLKKTLIETYKMVVAAGYNQPKHEWLVEDAQKRIDALGIEGRVKVVMTWPHGFVIKHKDECRYYYMDIKRRRKPIFRSRRMFDEWKND